MKSQEQYQALVAVFMMLTALLGRMYNKVRRLVCG